MDPFHYAPPWADGRKLTLGLVKRQASRQKATSNERANIPFSQNVTPGTYDLKGRSKPDSKNYVQKGALVLTITSRVARNATLKVRRTSETAYRRRPEIPHNYEQRNGYRAGIDP